MNIWNKIKYPLLIVLITAIMIVIRFFYNGRPILDRHGLDIR